MVNSKFGNIYIRLHNMKAIFGTSILQKNKFIKDNKIFHNSYCGRRCFILGNGPSLNNYDLALLKNEFVYCVNEFYRYKKFEDVFPNCYFIADSFYFNLKEDSIEGARFIKAIESILDRDIIFWVPFSEKEKVELYEWNKNNNIYYFNNNLSWYPGDYSLVKFDKCIPGMYAVIQYAILNAVYMGFNEIYLLGVEQTDIINTLKGYINKNEEYDYAFSLNEKETEWKRNQMQSYSLSTMLNGYSNIFYLYDELYEYCLFHKVDIFNLSPNSLIKSIPYKDWSSIFSITK